MREAAASTQVVITTKLCVQDRLGAALRRGGIQTFIEVSSFLYAEFLSTIERTRRHDGAVNE